MIENILAQGAFWMVNKKMAKTIGIEAAIFLSELITKRSYLNPSDLLDGEWFYHIQTQIEENTTLSPYQQRKAVQILKEYEFIETKDVGIPSKTHYRVFDNKLLSFLTTGSEKTSQLIYKELKNNNEYIYSEPIVNIDTVPEQVSNPVSQTDTEDEYWAAKKKRKEKKTSFSSFKPYPSPSVRSADPPPKTDFTPLSDIELWEIAKELRVPPQAPKIKQKEILERREDGSWQKHWGNTMRFAIKNFIRKDIERGTQETLDELGMIALQHDHPDEIAKRNIIWEEARKAGRL